MIEPLGAWVIEGRYVGEDSWHVVSAEPTREHAELVIRATGKYAGYFEKPMEYRVVYYARTYDENGA